MSMPSVSQVVHSSTTMPFSSRESVSPESDRAAPRWTGRGTQTGEIAGIAPTGKEVTVIGVTISRLEGNQVVEE